MVSNRSEIPQRSSETVTSMWPELNEAEQQLMTGRLQQWFADIEKNNNPGNNGTTLSLATRFLSYFGLKNAAEVFYFLKTAGGMETITMIARELMRQEEEIQSIREQNEEAMQKREHIVFLLMGLIAEREALAKNVDQLFRVEIERHLTKDKHAHTETISSRAVEIIDAMIDNYLSTIHALDLELNKLEEQLNEIEKEWIAIEEEEEQMEVYHEELHAHFDILNTFLAMPILSHPQENPAVFVERRRSILIQDLERYREQEALHRNTTSEDPKTQEKERRRICRHIKTIEHELNFHQAHLSQTVTNYEELFRLALEQTRSQIQELKSQTSFPRQLDTQIEGLQLREQGLVSALKVMRNKKILLNDQLEQVFDFSQARFIVKHEEAKCLIQKDDGSYALIPKDADPQKMTQEEWEQAKCNFNQEKVRIQTPRFNFMEKIQENLQKQIQRKEQHLSLREILQTQRSEMHRAREKMEETLSIAQTRKATLLSNPRLSQRSVLKPEPHASYKQIVEKFESLILTAPKKEDIEKVRDVVKNSSIPPESKGKLDKLIEQITPEKIMEPQKQRLQWLYSAKRTIMDSSPKPEVDPTKTMK
ncbi:hypothetical protein [Legionella parisiensis]|uniref:LidA long coiled-coil domain-containing protein n=1 Tax=Legionella parisiensis TaxID=45071 RepID=A0A1E5JP74_9GAMM|nr:hypothetical protein [Legionella parisiensis]KTD41982.1 hypothetical protein Lpar_3299 [Legionella parisiensis]OEH46346.1 hypothetical protein lpari_02685 [Legionella parisiensis]STX75585.1 Uncharacterised protein [Legionella parisiensis]